MELPRFNITIGEILEHTGELPFMPQVARKAIEVIQDSKTNMSDLTNVLTLDQALAGLVLRWVNSAYYGFRERISSVNQAVTLLGTRTVKNLVLTAAIADFMNKPVEGYALERGALWKHSIGLAAGAKLICMAKNPAIAEDAYFAGLFCDIGKLAFHRYLFKLEPYKDLIKDLPFDQVEKDVFGLNHAEVGSQLIKSWNLPEKIVSVVENHHTPARLENENKLIGYAVHAADVAITFFGIGLGNESFQYNLDPETERIVGWNDNVLENLYDRVIPIIEETENFLNEK